MSGEKTPAPTRGVPFELDGVTYRLRYSMLRLRQMREEIGEDIAKEGVTDERLVDALWYGLGAKESPLSKDDIADLVDLENMAVVVKALQKAMGMKVPSEPLPAPAANATEAAAPPA